MGNQEDIPVIIGGYMIFFYWDSYYDTGYSLMDTQHKDYIAIVEDLQKSVYSQDQDFFEKQSALFITHLSEHFTTENNLMIKYSYPGYFSHKAEHDRFFDKIKKNLTDLNKKSTNEINNFFEVTYRWFKNHLEINDRKLAKFLIENEKK